VRFNIVVRNQFLKASTWIVASDDTGERDPSTKSRCDHRNGGCATESVFLFVDTDHDAWLLGIQPRGIADQVAVEDQVAHDRDVRAFLVLRHRI